MLSSLHLCIQVSGGNPSRVSGLQELAVWTKSRALAWPCYIHMKQAFSLPAHELGAWKAFTVHAILQPTLAQMLDVCETKSRQLKPKGRMLLLPSCICGWCPSCLLRRGASDCLFASVLPPHTYPPTFSRAHDPHLDR